MSRISKSHIQVLIGISSTFRKIKSNQKQLIKGLIVCLHAFSFYTRVFQNQKQSLYYLQFIAFVPTNIHYIQMKIQIICFFLLLLFATSKLYPIPSECATNEYFNTITMSCSSCGPNQIGNWTQCVCKPGSDITFESSNPLNKNFTCGSPPCGETSITIQYYENGTQITDISQKCIPNCNGSTVPNKNRSACIYCGVGTTVQYGLCVCINKSQRLAPGGCYGGSDESSIYINYLPNNIKGCFTDKSQLQCSALMNICVYSLFSDSICSQLSSNGYLYVPESSYVANSTLDSSSNGVSSLNLVLMQYLPTGNYHSIKNFTLNDILYCSSISEYSFKLGNNYEHQCSFNFNNLLQMMISKKPTHFMYSLFIADQTGNYHLVPVQITQNGATILVSRFFIADLFSVPLTKSLTIMTQFILQITLNSKNQLVNPKVLITYTKLPLSSTGTLASPIATINYKVNFDYNVQQFYKVALPLFIVLTIFALIQAAIRTYISYLNRRSPFIFIIYFGENWSSWMFVLLLGLTGYWFFFTKATSTLYILMPVSGNLYPPFIGVVVAMVIIRALSIGWLKYDAYKTDIFFIDWEVSPLKNCWRQIFIANSLSEFFTFRTISFGWILIWTSFFLVGLGWENEGRTSTSLQSWTLFSTMNPILLFFIGTSVMFIIGIVFKILRKLVTTWWPHPFDDFVDFCCLANISVYFPQRSSPVGFYIHGNNASGSQITLLQLNDAILKGNLRKSNSLFNPGVSNSQANTFIMYCHNDLQYKLSQLRREDEQVSYDVGKKKGYIQLFKHRQTFINNDLKRMFLNLPRQRNQLFVRTTFQQYLGIPPVDLNTKRDAIALSADTNSNIHYIFPNSDQFGDLITFCILFGAFIVALKSSSIAAFITYFIMQWIVQSILGKAARVHIQSCTKVKQGFML